VSSETAIQRAVNIVGGQTKMAEILGVSQPRVWNWVHRDRNIPAEYVMRVSEAVEGKIQPHEFLPDVFPESLVV
jgi:DNA-binding transcriptional regulator YdaS (Cro superfamily)